MSPLMLARHYRRGWLLSIMHAEFDQSLDKPVPVPSVTLLYRIGYQVITATCCRKHGTSHQRSSPLFSILVPSLYVHQLSEIPSRIPLVTPEPFLHLNDI